MSRLSKNVIIYFIGNTVNRFMGLIVMLIATHLVDKTDLGFFNYISNCTNILVTTCCLQIWMAIIRFVFDYKTIKGKLKVISSGYFVECLTFFACTVVIIIYSVTQKYSIWFTFEILLLNIGYAFNQGVQFACRGLGKNKLYVISGMVGSFMQLLSSVIFLFVFKMKYSALILSTAISYISQGAFIELFLRTFKHTKLKYVDVKVIKKMIQYSIPTTLNFLAYWFNQNAYIWLLKIYYNNAAVGMFTPAYKMTSLIGFFVMSFNYAFQEYSFFVNKSNKRGKMYNTTFNSFLRFISSGTIILLPATSIFFSFMGRSYKGAKYLVPILYLGSILDSLQIFLGSIMQAEKKVISMFFSQLVGLATTIITMNIANKFVNLQSAGFAMVFCFLIVATIRIISINSTINLKFNMLYVLQFIPIYVLTSYVYIRYNEIINFLYSILAALYFIVCNKNLIFKLILKFCSKNKT